jgi:hypothetical protein
MCEVAFAVNYYRWMSTEDGAHRKQCMLEWRYLCGRLGDRNR